MAINSPWVFPSSLELLLGKQFPGVESLGCGIWMLLWFSVKAPKLPRPSCLPPAQPRSTWWAQAADMPRRNVRGRRPWGLAQHRVRSSQSPAVGPLHQHGGEGGQERGVDALGNEAIMWHFLQEQLQIGGNDMPAERAGQSEPGNTRSPHQPRMEAEPLSVCPGLQGAMGWRLGNLLSHEQEWSGLGRRIGHSPTCLPSTYSMSALCARFGAGNSGHKRE